MAARRFGVLIVLCCTAAWIPSAWAGHITGFSVQSSAGGTVNSVGVSGTSFGNDSAEGVSTASPNRIDISLTITAYEPFEIIFNTVIDTIGTQTEYFVTVDAFIQTAPYNTFRVELFPTGADPLHADLDLDAPAYQPAPSSTPTSAVTTQPTTIRYLGEFGDIQSDPNDPDATYTFSLDVPNFTTNSGQFGLRLAPTPEPGSMTLAGVSMALLGGLAARRRKRRRDFNGERAPSGA